MHAETHVGHRRVDFGRCQRGGQPVLMSASKCLDFGSEWRKLCKQLDLFGREPLAVDGTRINTVNYKDRNFTRTSLTESISLADGPVIFLLNASDARSGHS